MGKTVLNMENIFSRIIKVCLYSLVFLLPFFFLPFSFEFYDFNKQYLLFILVTLAVLCWVAKMVWQDKEIRFRRTPLDIPVLAFLAVAVISAVLSVDRVSSVFGFYGRFSDGIIGLLSLGIFYFLITNNVTLAAAEPDKDSNVEMGKLIKMFLCSAGVVMLATFAAVLGLWAKIGSQLAGVGAIPQAMLQPGFNPVGASMDGLAMFLAVFAVLLTGTLLLKNKEGKKPSIFNYLLLIAAILLLLVIDFTPAWFVVLAVFVPFVALSLWSRIFKEDVNKLLTPILIIIIAVVCLALDMPGTIRGLLSLENWALLPQEIVLGQNDSWKIGLETIRADWKSTLIGSGVGTWHYDFSRFKSPEFNKNLFWMLRFDRPGNHIAELLSTMGALGLVSYLVLVGMFVLISWLLLQSAVSKSEIRDSKLLFLLMTFIASLAAQFVYYQNTTLAFVFWLILGLAVVSWQKPVKEKVFSFKDFPELSLVFNLFLMFLILAVIGCYFFFGKFYFADLNYARAMRTQDNVQTTAYLRKAVELNPYQPQYKIILSRMYFNQVSAELAKPAAEQNQTILTENVYYAINYLKGGIVGNIYVKGATELAPNRVAAWETLGMVYRDIRLLAAGATDWGIKAFSRALELEPTNPILHTELGKMYIFQNETEKARAEFEKAKELKSDYADAQIQLALILEKENKLADAIAIMEDLVKLYPNNTEVLFQLGRFYYNENRTDETIDVLKQVVDLLPAFSNARYVLGLAYIKKGEKDSAIFEFEKILELNPGNEDVQSKLKELRGE